MFEFLDQNIPESIKVFLGGNQLTCERIRRGQKAHLQSRERKKLQQFIAKIEEWHVLQAYYQVIWEELYSTSSVRDKGTLYQLRALIDCRNVVSDPKKDLHACQSFYGLPQAAPILFSFRPPVGNAQYIYIYIYIYIICTSTRNHNNAFILEFILRETKMADFECRQLEIQLEFVR